MIHRSMATLRAWRGPRGIALKHLAVLLGLLVVAGGGFAAWRMIDGAPAAPSAGVMPLNAEMEERFGIRFTFVAVTANGGFVDLRYRVIDEGKAKNFGHYTETSPRLIVEDTGQVVDVTVMGQHNHRVEPGRIYYILFRNTANAIEPGMPVTIAIDDMRIEHAVAW